MRFFVLKVRRVDWSCFVLAKQCYMQFVRVIVHRSLNVNQSWWSNYTNQWYPMWQDIKLRNTVLMSWNCTVAGARTGYNHEGVGAALSFVDLRQCTIRIEHACGRWRGALFSNCLSKKQSVVLYVVKVYCKNIMFMFLFLKTIHNKLVNLFLSRLSWSIGSDTSFETFIGHYFVIKLLILFL